MRPSPAWCVEFYRSAYRLRRSRRFPTRRSSDLWLYSNATSRLLKAVQAQPLLANDEPEFRRMAENMSIASGLPRSEEHTSELQSPCNLVCRLLLEKKKKKSQNGKRSHSRRKTAS